MPTLAARLHDLQLRALERLADLMESDDPKEARLAATAILKFKLPDPPETPAEPAPTVAPLSERCLLPSTLLSPSALLATTAGTPTSLFSTTPRNHNSRSPHKSPSKPIPLTAPRQRTHPPPPG